MVDLIAFVAPAECADGGDDGGGADAPRLLERAGLGGLEQLVHAQQPLLDGNVPALQKLDGGFARDAAQDGAGQRGSDDGAVDLEHDVHAAALLDVLTLHAVEPQHLRVALGLGTLAGTVGRAVVAAALGLARAAAHRAHILGLDHDGHRLEPVGEVAAGGGEDDDERRLMHTVQGQRRVGGIQERADVERCAGVVRHPSLIDADDLLDSLQRVVGIELRQTQTLAGAV